MIVILVISILVFGLYAIYPIFLKVFCSSRAEYNAKTNPIQEVSLILLTYNGRRYLADKIDFLLKELAHFEKYELIIIDDKSKDGTEKLLDEFLQNDKIKLVSKGAHTGIPASMNLGVKNARYDNIVFCDQRQRLSENSLQKIVEPLQYAEVGAVSGCLSSLDKDNNDSLIRRHENEIKCNESKSGNLIGVYGPFYAIKKNCYSFLPNHIILDDLYLSLKILKSKFVVIASGCMMTDDNFSRLYNYSRVKRYLKGLVQLLFEKNLIGDLSGRQRTMLLWHKYSRLLIPLLSFVGYLFVGYNIYRGPGYFIAFSLISLLGLGALFENYYKFTSKYLSVVRINILYLIAMFDLLLGGFLSHLNIHFDKSRFRLKNKKETIQSKVHY
ncbi:MAG: hypothetical protein DRH89_07550 [Candidatus Cloacimonadota bacterium]|nr:MAG: hypothetical protein DRH89_07550 [Candidatus Cloacimonadota bacterium]